MELLEIKGVTESDGRPVHAVAPDDVPAVLKPENARIVSLREAPRRRAFREEADRFRRELPVDAVFAETGVQLHVAAAVVGAENAGEPVRNGTTALLNTLFEVGVASRPMTGLPLYRQTVSRESAGRSCHGIEGRAGAKISILMINRFLYACNRRWTRVFRRFSADVPYKPPRCAI